MDKHNDLSSVRIFGLDKKDNLARSIAKKLGVNLGSVECRTFADGEEYVRFNENIRETEVYIVQSTSSAEDCMKLFVALEAANASFARNVTAVIPYYGYARQDRQAKPREPISARLLAKLIETAGATRILVMDLHNTSISGFFRIPVTHIYARPVLIRYVIDDLKNLGVDLSRAKVSSADVGGVARTRSYGEKIFGSAKLAIIHKERGGPNEVERMTLVGDVSGMSVILIDDIADTCGTLVRASDLLVEKGAKEVFAVVTHGLFSSNASELIDRSPISRMYVSDSLNPKSRPAKSVIVHTGDLLGEAIKRMVTGDSVAELME